MLSKAQNKYIRSLTQQKFRNEYKVFIAEGEKIALEWLNSGTQIQMVITTAEWERQYHAKIATHPEAELHIVKDSELAAISTLQTPNHVILVVPMPVTKNAPVKNEWYLALDDIQDPGNMGTLIRIADWFGIPNVICTPGCVDFYNSKVVQSAMGGHLRVGLFESDPEEFLKAIQLPKLAATLGGQDVYKMNRLKAGVLIIGNESHGVSGKVLSLTTEQITIPRRGGAESLNAGVSAGILCALLLPC